MRKPSISPRLRGPAAVAAIVAAAFAVHVAPASAESVPLPDDDPFYAVPANIAGLPNGAILNSRQVTATALSVPLAVTAWQVQYKSLDSHDKATADVATVMVPDQPWNGSGARPLVSYQTAEDGVGSKCSPSYALRAGAAALGSNSSLETLAMATALLRGYALVAPDYEGPHSEFLGATGEGHGVLDGIRAARAFRPAGFGAATPLGVWGYSGGALASSLAAHLQPAYAPELKLSAIALGGVVADIKATLLAFSGSPLGGALIIGFVGVDRAYPEEHIQQYLNGDGRQAMATSQTDCINDASAKYPFGSIERFATDPQAFELPQVTALLKRISPLGVAGTPSAPVYDYHAVADEYAPIGPDRALMTRYCRAGVPVDHYEDLASEHVSLTATGVLGALGYFDDRFTGRPAPNNCTVPPDRAGTPPGPSCAARDAQPHAYLMRATLRASRRGLSVQGRAFALCSVGVPAAAASVGTVTVAIGRIAGTRCRFLDPRGRWTASRSCRKAVGLKATGTTSWSLKRAIALPAGRYRIYVQASTVGGRREPLPPRQNAVFRVR